jgi:hypothetical protein
MGNTGRIARSRIADHTLGECARGYIWVPDILFLASLMSVWPGISCYLGHD